MAHHEVVFPLTYGINSGGGPAFNTEVVTTEGGQEQRFANQEHPRRKYSVNYGDRKPEVTAEVAAFFIAREGAVNSFNFKDPSDYTSNDDGVTAPGDDVLLGTGNGSTTTFQLIKKYEDSAASKTRTIKKVVANSVKVYLDSVETLSFTVDLTTGIITLLSAPGGGVEVSAGFEFYTPVRFDDGIDEDGMRTLVTNPNNHQIDSIDLIEVLDDDVVNDDAFFGGSSEKTITADIELVKTDGLVQVIKATSGTPNVDLPAHTYLNPGGPHFIIIIANGSNNINIRDESDTTLVSGLTANSVVECYIVEDNVSAKHWYVVGS